MAVPYTMQLSYLCDNAHTDINTESCDKEQKGICEDPISCYFWCMIVTVLSLY